jgi:hypothetical protein
MKAALKRYSTVLPVALPDDVLAMLAESAEGDLRHAIMSMVMYGKTRGQPRPPPHAARAPPVPRTDKAKLKYVGLWSCT